MDVTECTIKPIILSRWISVQSSQSSSTIQEKPIHQPILDLFQPLRKQLNGIKIHNQALAHRICKLIPSQCPFARQIKFLGHPILTIPPLCKINPLYEELMALRFRAICYLADECGEDISTYC